MHYAQLQIAKYLQLTAYAFRDSHCVLPFHFFVNCVTWQYQRRIVKSGLALYQYSIIEFHLSINYCESVAKIQSWVLAIPFYV